MPKALFADLSQYDLSHHQITRDEIYSVLPHRYEAQQLDGIVRFDLDTGFAIAVREIRDDEWWCRGHIPGRPIFPGVLMVESAAQLASYGAYIKLKLGPGAFIGFGGIDNCKFRRGVEPGQTLYIISQATEVRPRRVKADTQGIVDGELVFETSITGLIF